MIIWGSRGVTSVLETNQFNCPRCSQKRSCKLKQVRNYFTLYFIPLIPMTVAGRYVECDSCGGTFAEEIMQHDPEKERQETFTQLTRVMVLAALADGHVNEAEREAIKNQYMEFAGLPIPSETLENEIQMAQQASNISLNDYVRRIEGELSPHGRALVVKLAFVTMASTGGLQPGHSEQLAKLGDTLRIPPDQFRELITRLSQPKTAAS